MNTSVVLKRNNQVGVPNGGEDIEVEMYAEQYVQAIVVVQAGVKPTEHTHLLPVQPYSWNTQSMGDMNRIRSETQYNASDAHYQSIFLSVCPQPSLNCMFLLSPQSSVQLPLNFQSHVSSLNFHFTFKTCLTTHTEILRKLESRNCLSK